MRTKNYAERCREIVSRYRKQFPIRDTTDAEIITIYRVEPDEPERPDAKCPGCAANTRLYAGTMVREYPPSGVKGPQFSVFVAGQCGCDYAFIGGKWKFMAEGIRRE